jgi:hypothetical protein
MKPVFPLVRLRYEGDFSICPRCGSSLAKKWGSWWLFWLSPISSMCIQPKCSNCHPRHLKKEE